MDIYYDVIGQWESYWTHFATRMSDLVVLWTLKLKGVKETVGSSTCMPYMGISFLNL